MMREVTSLDISAAKLEQLIMFKVSSLELLVLKTHQKSLGKSKWVVIHYQILHTPLPLILQAVEYGNISPNLTDMKGKMFPMRFVGH